MKQTTKKFIIIWIITLIVLVLGIRVIFDEKFDNFNKMIEARNNAEDKEEFDRNFEQMWKWFDEYKENNPWATDEDAEAAWKTAWGE